MNAEDTHRVNHRRRITMPRQGKERERGKASKQASKQGNLSTRGFDSSNLINGFLRFTCVYRRRMYVFCSMYIYNTILTYLPRTIFHTIPTTITSYPVRDPVGWHDIMRADHRVFDAKRICTFKVWWTVDHGRTEYGIRVRLQGHSPYIARI